MVLRTLDRPLHRMFQLAVSRGLVVLAEAFKQLRHNRLITAQVTKTNKLGSLCMHVDLVRNALYIN